ACGGEGEYYSNARWYDPTLGRFLTEDPARDGINWFAYVNNNPLAHIDPTGLGGPGIGDDEEVRPVITQEFTNPKMFGGLGGAGSPSSAAESAEMDAEYAVAKIAATAQGKTPEEMLPKPEPGTCAAALEADRAAGNPNTTPNARAKVPQEVSKAPSPKAGQGSNADQAKSAPARNANGGVDFSGTSSLYPAGEGQSNSVVIEYTGSRRKDFGAANQAAGTGTTQKPPEGYTWHHLDNYDPVTNTGTMQLVERSAHE